MADIAAICELSQLTNESYFQARLEELGLKTLTPELRDFKALGAHIRKLAQDSRIRDELEKYLEKLLAVWP